MNNHHPLLSIVLILLTSPAWADLCADPYTCVGQPSRPAAQCGTDNMDLYRVGYSLGQDEGTIGDAVFECGSPYAGCPGANQGARGMDLYRWMCILTAQLHNQIEQTQQGLCFQVGGAHMSLGVLQVGCPINICLP